MAALMNLFLLSGRTAAHLFIPPSLIAIIGYVALHFHIAYFNENFWDAWPFWGQLLLSALFLVLFWSAVARRFHDAGFRAWFPIVATCAVLGMKAYFGVIWFFADNREFEFGMEIWNIAVEPPIQALLILICLPVLAKPSQPSPNKYGPNPTEVSS